MNEESPDDDDGVVTIVMMMKFSVCSFKNRQKVFKCSTKK